MKAKIAVLAGDGVGREIVPEAIKVLKAIGEKYQHAFEFVSADIGGQAIDKVGVPLPQETLALAKQSDAVLLGAVGGLVAWALVAGSGVEPMLPLVAVFGVLLILLGLYLANVPAYNAWVSRSNLHPDPTA